MVLKRRIIVFLLLLTPWVVMAQVDDAVELWVDEREDTWVSDMNDLLLQLADNPVNLNDTNAVSIIPFVTPFQLRSLKNYIILHGQLLSEKELLMIPGFDSMTVALLTPYVKIEPYSPPPSLTLSDLLSRGRHTVVSGIGGTVEQAQGYENGRYEGDNLRALFCYSFNYADHISLRISADKDPTEAWGKDNFYGYHLMVSNLGRIEKLIVGRYNLRFGQGVTLWTGFEPFSLLGESPIRYGDGVRPASAFSEQGWQEGVAATVNMGRGVALSGFGSRHDGDWFGGGHIEYRHENLILGATLTLTKLDDSLSVGNYTYNQDYFRGDRQAAFGIDALWQVGRLTLFGEVAVDHKGAPAGIGGARLSAGENSIGLTFRHYGPRYHNLHSAAYNMSETRNEQGVSLDARLRLPWAMTALLSVDVHRFPSLKYGVYAPSAGAWLRGQLTRQFGRSVEASVRFSLRQNQRNIPNIDSVLYLGEESARQQLQGRVKVSMDPWIFTTRGVLSWYDAEQTAGQKGWLVSQEARYSTRQWQMALQATWFDVEGYNARIYLTESNLQYSFGVPMLYNRGLRTSTVVRYDINKWLNLSAKYTLTFYPGQTSIGSGDAMTDGNHRQTWHLQLRWKF